MAPTRATRDWRRIAQGGDPLYSIASVPGKEGRWTQEEFYEHGRADWEAFKHQWDHYAPGRGGTCVEIGCGAGRITTPMASDFDRVIAFDVSPDMLERARAVVPANVDLRETDGRSLPVGTAEADAVFSVHVIQHLEGRDDVLAYFREIRRLLRPGGTLLVHVMLKGAPIGQRERARDWWKLQRSRIALRLGREHSTILTHTYWLDDIYWMLDGLGFANIELRMFDAGGYGTQCWFATVPAE